MQKECMNLRERAVEHIQHWPNSAVVEVANLYSEMEAAFPDYCDPDLLTPDGKELKWRKDVRWALQDCKRHRIIEHIGSAKSGKWKRL
jgi:hypothetical protein